MSIKKSFLCFLVFTISSLCLFVESSEEEEAVVSLTNVTFADFIQENQHVLVEFYSLRCSICKRLEPEYKKAAEELKKKKSTAILAKVDADADKQLSEKFEIRGYPTIFFFRNGVQEEYSGGRTANEIVAWVEKMTRESVTIVEDADDFIKKESISIAIVGYFKSRETDEFKTFMSVADGLRNFCTFLAVIGEKKPHGTIVAIKEEEEISYTGDANVEDALKQWAKDESFPLFGPVNGDNFRNYLSRQQEIVWMCGDKKDFEQYKKPVKEAAKPLKANYSFVWLDKDAFKGHAEGALGVSTFPALVYQSKQGRFVLSDAAESLKDSEKILKFFRDVADGKIEKFLKSEDIPETNDKPVKIVVGKNFVEMVLQEKKDVMLEVYAPWCGHCKQLEPVYEEVAKKMLEFEDKVIIAKMDGTANESPVEEFDWTGFPTLFFVKAGTKSPIKYEGGRKAEDIIEFIKKNSSFKLDKAAEKEEL